MDVKHLSLFSKSLLYVKAIEKKSKIAEKKLECERKLPKEVNFLKISQKREERKEEISKGMLCSRTSANITNVIKP